MPQLAIYIIVERFKQLSPSQIRLPSITVAELYYGFVCKDGPVFSLAQLRNMPPEY